MAARQPMQSWSEQQAVLAAAELQLQPESRAPQAAEWR
jgi:hypothetical protein